MPRLYVGIVYRPHLSEGDGWGDDSADYETYIIFALTLVSPAEAEILLMRVRRGSAASLRWDCLQAADLSERWVGWFYDSADYQTYIIGSLYKIARYRTYVQNLSVDNDSPSMRY